MGNAYIVLSDGHVFQGKSFGAVGDSIGELVFTTGMVGCIETLTDPVYDGQIVVQTFPLIGNYGIIADDCESDRSFVRGYVVREWCGQPSNFCCEQTVDAYLKKQGIVGVYGVDTRELTRTIRENGVMIAMIVTSLDHVDPAELDAFKIVNPVKSVSVVEHEIYMPETSADHKVVVVDYGRKRNIVRELVRRGCAVQVVPYDTSAAEILALHPDGVVLGSGPGDPADNVQCIAELRELIGKLPLFGIGLGHQLLALAMGAKTVKLKYGHRGDNQPVKDLQTGHIYSTRQNHGYVVVNESVTATGGILSFINANDNTCEGIDYPGKHAFSVQFSPESCSGQRNAHFLMERFITNMGGSAHAAG